MTSYNLFTTTPQLVATNDTGPLNLGTEFYVTAAAWLTEFRYLQPATGTIDTQTRTAGLFTVSPDGNTGTLVSGPFSIPAPLPGAWGKAALPVAYQLTPNTRYRAVIHHPGGQYPATGAYFAGADQVTGPLVVPSSTSATVEAQGSYAYGPVLAFPEGHFNATAYYSDVTISDTDPSAPPPPPPPPSDAVDITVTGSLDPQRWNASLPARTRTGTLDTKRWAGSL